MLLELCESTAALKLQVLRRIFPLRRGLYEDYVANFWCTSSAVLKWKQVRRAREEGGVLCS